MLNTNESCLQSFDRTNEIPTKFQFQTQHITMLRAKFALERQMTWNIFHLHRSFSFSSSEGGNFRKDLAIYLHYSHIKLHSLPTNSLTHRWSWRLDYIRIDGMCVCIIQYSKYGYIHKGYNTRVLRVFENAGSLATE